MIGFYNLLIMNKQRTWIYSRMNLDLRAKE
jgi:hypothetical protein